MTGIAKLAREGRVLEEKAATDYRELPSRKLLNRCGSAMKMFTWTLNPYRGCEYGCKYCYARYTHEFMELREPADFETKIFVKPFDEQALRRELRGIHRDETIAIGTATDPYQPAERRYQRTRQILEVFARLSGYRVYITTKSDLVARDAELLARVGERNEVGVSLTITTCDTALARLTEPLAPRPDLRFKAVRALSSAGVPARVYSSPVLPWINDSEESLAAIAEEAQRNGAVGFGAGVLFLQPCSKQVFLPFVRQVFPHLLTRYQKLYRESAYVRGSYPALIQERVERIRERLGFAQWRREIPAPPQMPLFDLGTVPELRVL